jgi:molybdate transport system permease protein
LDATAVWLTLKLATCTTLVLMVIGLPLAYWLASSTRRWRFAVDAAVALPLLLPPTVLGYYLLVGMGPHSLLGRWYEKLAGQTLPFSFLGILIGSVIYNLPFAVRPFTAAFASVDRRLIEASWCLGVSRGETFRRVTVPLCWPGILTGMVLAFAHTVGEFGVVLMIGGNRPGVTRTISVAIYDDVQALNYAAAANSAAVLLIFAFTALCVTYALSRRTMPL